MNIIETIQQYYDGLTNKQKEIANYLIKKPSNMCYISLSDLSKRIGCSEVTILKFCKKIGFQSFTDLKKEFRNYNQMLIDRFSTSSYIIPSEIIDKDSKVSFLKNLCNKELSRLSDFYNKVDLENINLISNLIINNDIVYIFAHDASKIIASFLQNRLQILNFNTVLVDLANMKQTEYVLKQIKEKDISIIISFPNYYYSIGGIAEHIKEKNCEIILITNSLQCPVSEHTNNILLCETRTKIFYNSWLLPIAALNLLTSNLAMLIEKNI